jgi:DNA polymerase-3 subunit delta
MEVRAEGLEAQLAKSLAPVYTIHGDEPLLALEAADRVRAAARQAGCGERLVMVAERGFDWSEFAHALAARSLFGARRIVELRIPGGRPGVEGAEAIRRACARLDPQDVVLVSLPRLRREEQAAGWFAALGTAGVVVEVRPVERARLPDWIAARLARQGQHASREGLEFLAQRVEGNLLAAQQEVAKLALLAPAGTLALEAIEAAVANVARYSPEDLLEALFAGEIERYARVLAGLRGEGETAAALAWRVGEELVALLAVHEGVARGERREPLYARNRVWRSRQGRYERALRRLDGERVRGAVRHAARIERAAKGVGAGEPWDELLLLGLQLADATPFARESA